jgi:hypothetical protein
MPKPNDLGFRPEAAVIGASIKTPEQLAHAICANFDPSNGGNFSQLAEQYGLTLVQVHKLIFAHRPDLYEQHYGKAGPSSTPRSHESQPGTSAASSPSRMSHRTDRAASNQKRLDRLKKWWRTRLFARKPASTATVPRTGCSVRITGDIAGLSLSILPANGQALELTFSSDDRNADKRRSCRD